MPTQKITIPASSTDQVLTLTLPDNVPFALTGGTPIVTPPPVVTPPPPVTGGLLDGYTLVYESTFASVKEVDPYGHQQYGSDNINNHFDTVNGNPAPSFKSKPTGNISAGVRSEIDLTEKTPYPEGAVQFDMCINKPVWQNGHCFQLHPDPDTSPGGSASPGLWFVGQNKFDWHNWDKASGKNISHPVSWSPVLSKWNTHTVLFKIGKDGYFKHYIDNVLVCLWTGQVGDGTTGRPYLKVGYNGWDTNSLSSDINYDNIRIYNKV